MQINKTATRILSPVMLTVRDSLKKVCDIDKYELKDDSNVVIGWTIPKSLFEVPDLLKTINVNGYVRVARSMTNSGDFMFEKFTYRHTEGNILISLSVFIDSTTIEVM